MGLTKGSMVGNRPQMDKHPRGDTMPIKEAEHTSTWAWPPGDRNLSPTPCPPERLLLHSTAAAAAATRRPRAAAAMPTMVMVV